MSDIVTLRNKETGEVIKLRKKSQEQAEPQEQPQEQAGQSMVNQPQPEQNNKLLAMLLGGGGAAAYTAYRGGLVPNIQESYQANLQKEEALTALGNLQQQLGIQETQLERIPQKIGELEKANKLSFQQQKSKLDYDFGLALKNSKSALDDFDNKILTSKIEETAKTLREAHPVLKQNFSRGYEAGKVAIETYLADKGIKFNSLDFETRFLDKAIQRSISEGALPEELTPLLKLKETISPKFSGNALQGEKPVSFNQMRGYVSGITKNYPNSKIAPIINEEWLNFLDTNLPQDVSSAVRGQLEKLRVNYRQFANADRQLSSIVGKAGEFNTDKSNAYLMKYIKSNIDNGVEELGKFVAKGNEISEGVPQVMKQLDDLTGLKTHRAELSRQIPVVKQMQQEAINKNADDFIKTAQKYAAWKSKYNDMTSMLAKQQEKRFGSAVKNIFRGLKTIGTAGKIAGFGAMAVMQFKDIIRFSQDPEGYIYSIETGGGELAPKGSMEREIQTKRLI